jgi:hypothetical protein
LKGAVEACEILRKDAGHAKAYVESPPRSFRQTNTPMASPLGATRDDDQRHAVAHRPLWRPRRGQTDAPRSARQTGFESTTPKPSSATGSVEAEPGSPWENGYIESFDSKLRDELLNGELFSTFQEAQIPVAGWRRL